MPGRKTTLGHPHLLLGRVPGVMEGQHVPVGSILTGAAIAAMGVRQAELWCFLSIRKGIFWGLLVMFKPKVEEPKVKEWAVVPGGRQAWGHP